MHFIPSACAEARVKGPDLVCEHRVVQCGSGLTWRVGASVLC